MLCAILCAGLALAVPSVASSGTKGDRAVRVVKAADGGPVRNNGQLRTARANARRIPGYFNGDPLRVAYAYEDHRSTDPRPAHPVLRINPGQVNPESQKMNFDPSKIRANYYEEYEKLKRMSFGCDVYDFLWPNKNLRGKPKEVIKALVPCPFFRGSNVFSNANGTV